MTTDFNDQQNEQATEHAPVAPPRGEIWMNDVKDTGRWGSRSRREVLAVVAAIIVMIVATATGVYLAAKNANQSNVEEPANNEPVGNTKLDPVTGKLVSAYELPKKPENILISDQQELDMIISALSSNDVTSDMVAIIPKTVAELSTTTLEDPYVKAAAWITNVDATNVQQDVIQRYSLAVFFYSTNGVSWKNSTNWMSKSYHCDWYGVKCCEHTFGNAICKLDSFGEVLELDFYRNNLVGPIPSVVVLLQYLHVLYLNKNKMTGEIPGKAFASMKNFAKFYAQYNQLSGVIPEELASSSLSKYLRWKL